MDYQLSDHQYVRRELFNLHVKGGLKHPGRVQKLQGWFYDATLVHKPKIVINFGIASMDKDEFVESPSSLRFDNYTQLKSLIFHLLRGSVLLGKTTGRFNEQNKGLFIQRDIEAIKEHYQEMLL